MGKASRFSMRWVARLIFIDSDPRSKKSYTTRWIIKGVNDNGRMTGPPPSWSRARFISWGQACKAIKYYEETGLSYSEYKKMKSTDKAIQQAFNHIETPRSYPIET